MNKEAKIRYIYKRANASNAYSRNTVLEFFFQNIGSDYFEALKKEEKFKLDQDLIKAKDRRWLEGEYLLKVSTDKLKEVEKVLEENISDLNARESNEIENAEVIRTLVKIVNNVVIQTNGKAQLTYTLSELDKNAEQFIGRNPILFFHFQDLLLTLLRYEYELGLSWLDTILEIDRETCNGTIPERLEPYPLYLQDNDRYNLFTQLEKIYFSDIEYLKRFETILVQKVHACFEWAEYCEVSKAVGISIYWLHKLDEISHYRTSYVSGLLYLLAQSLQLNLNRLSKTFIHQELLKAEDWPRKGERFRKRMLLYLYSIDPEKFNKNIWNILDKKEYLTDSFLLYESRLMVYSFIPTLSTQEVTSVLDKLDYDPHKLKERERNKLNGGYPPHYDSFDEYYDTKIRAHKSHLFKAIRPYLSDEQKDKYKEYLEGEDGFKQHLDMEVSLVAPPLSKQNLYNVSLENVLRKIEDSLHQASVIQREEIGKPLMQIVSEETEKYIKGLDKFYLKELEKQNFPGTELNIQILSAVYQGLEEGITTKKLDLDQSYIQKIIESIDMNVNYLNVNYKKEYKDELILSVFRLLSSVVHASNDPQKNEQALNVVEEYIVDDRQKSTNSNMDHFQKAYNSLAGNAICIVYRIMQAHLDESENKTLLYNSKEKIFESLSKRNTDVYAIHGWWFPWFYQWTVEFDAFDENDGNHIFNVLFKSNKSIDLSNAVWQGMLYNNVVQMDTFQKMQQEYLKVLRQPELLVSVDSSYPEKKKRRFVDFIVVAYIEEIKQEVQSSTGKYMINSVLAEPNIMNQWGTYFVESIGMNHIYDVQQKEDERVQKELQELWKQFLDNELVDKQVLSHFGTWVNFDFWSEDKHQEVLDLFHRTLQKTEGKTTSEMKIIEHLDKYKEVDIEKLLLIIRELLAGVGDEYQIFMVWDETLQELLRHIINQEKRNSTNTSNKKLREIISEMIDYGISVDAYQELSAEVDDI